MKTIKAFNFPSGKILSAKYEVIEKLGGGWEGEVYLVREIDTMIERAAKFFYPHRNPMNRTVKSYAKKLHKLQACNSLIKYLAKDTMLYHKQRVTYLLSEYVEGHTLDTYQNSYYPKGIPYYQALHIFYAIVKAVEEIHINKEWHGDIHSDNIIIQKSGLRYDLKLIDVFQLSHGQKATRQDDIFFLVDLLFEMIGGSSQYKKQPQIIKDICKGKKRGLIAKQFKHATQLRVFLENRAWE